jgi:hypothetical protein
MKTEINCERNYFGKSYIRNGSNVINSKDVCGSTFKSELPKQVCKTLQPQVPNQVHFGGWFRSVDSNLKQRKPERLESRVANSSFYL